jgi:NhaP-type Na+/H+ or K+/H+ antiporter
MVTQIKQKMRDNLAVILLILAVCALNVADIFFKEQVSGAGELLPIILIAGILLLSALSSALAKGTIFPSFLVALFAGVSLHYALQPIVQSTHILNTVVTISAVYILFSGGLEISFASFKKILLPTLLLSFVGLGLSTFLLPAGLLALSGYFDLGISVTVALLLGAILASTDPAAIIPVIKELRFKKQEIKDIVISESALTDVTGTLVTFAFLFYLGTHSVFHTIGDGLRALNSTTSAFFLMKEIVIGIIAGCIGFIMLHSYLQRRRKVSEHCSDVPLFIAAPLVAFGIAALFHGSGYLASFVAGLLILTHEHVHKTETFFVSMTDGIAKPLVFILLGAMVDVSTLLAYILPGILAGLLFILIVRPLSVFISLYPWKKKLGLSSRDLWFISAVRETGVIPAVLLLQTMNIPSLGLGPAFLSIGMWVIIMTLIVLPPITPWIARRLGVAEGSN